MGKKKTGFHFTVFPFVSISNSKKDKPCSGDASADSCVLLLNISGGEVGRRSVYIACKISCKTLRGPGLKPKGLSCWIIHSIPSFLLFFFHTQSEQGQKKESDGGLLRTPCPQHGSGLPPLSTRVQGDCPAPMTQKCHLSTELLVSKVKQTSS